MSKEGQPRGADLEFLEIGPIAGNWVIGCGVAITRRKSYYLVRNPEGQTVFAHRTFWPCVEYLYAIDVHEYLIAPSEPPTGAPLRALVVRRENQIWQS